MYNQKKKILCFASEKREKINFTKLNQKNISDIKKFWHTVKHFLSDKVKSKEAIILVNNENKNLIKWKWQSL